MSADDRPWPEAPERVEARVRGTVDSVLRPGELDDVRLEWVTTSVGSRALAVTVRAGRDEVFHKEIWDAASSVAGPSWDDELRQLASDLEDWVSESAFGWGEQRVARVPE